MTTIAIPIEVSDQTLGDILTTALEGGIGYWSFASKIKRNDDLTVTSVVLSPCPGDEWGVFPDDRDRTALKINASEMAAAVERVLCSDPPLCNGRIRDSIRHELIYTAEHPEDGCAIDADGADVIVQVHCFGGIVFG